MSNNQSASEAPARLRSDVTFALLVLNICVFIYEWRLGRVRPLELLEFERTYALRLSGVQHGAWWQFLTYQFLHGNWVHLVVNLLVLQSLGPVLETTLGPRRYLVLFLFSGVLGGAVHLLGAWMSPNHFGQAVVGASAGLCGLLAALSAIYAEERVRGLLFFVIPFTVRAKFLLLAAGIVSVVGAILPVRWLSNIAHLAHLGGLLGGLWCVNWMNARPILTSAADDTTDEPSSTG